MNRTFRIVALFVLLVSAVQIGMCAFDCNCFLPSARGIMARSLADADGCGDADGCVCAACGHFTRLMDLPRLAWADFAPSRSTSASCDRRRFAAVSSSPPLIPSRPF